eukprot:COSAG02_NODE_252_length_26996_cov_29.825607_6_plen_203_part_00
MAPLPGELESFYLAPGIAVWATDGASDSWEGVVAGMPRDELGIWPVRKSDKTEAMVPWQQLRPRATFAPTETPTSAPTAAPAPTSSPIQRAGGGKKDKACGPAASKRGKGTGKTEGKDKGNNAASGSSQPSSLAPSAVEPVDAFMQFLSTAGASTLGQVGIDSAALAAAHASAAAELRPWLKMSLRSFKNSAAAAGALSGRS